MLLLDRRQLRIVILCKRCTVKTDHGNILRHAVPQITQCADGPDRHQMEMFPVCEIARSQGIEQVIYNRGVSGLNTDEFLENIDTLLLDLEPSKIFINIGTNDITKERFGDQWMSHLMDNICRIMEIIKFRIPDVEIFIMAFYPANLHLPWQTEQSIQWMKRRTPENLTLCNHRLKEIAEKYGCRYLDCNEALVDEHGEQKSEYAIDGVHMYANGYLNVFKSLKPYL